MTLTHQRFTFDTVFDDGGGIASQAVRPKRAYTAEEVQLERAQAFSDGERSVVARAELAASAALADIAASVRSAFSALTGLAHDHRSITAELSLACARTIAGAALERFPEAPTLAAFEALGREIEAAPRLVVRVSADLVDRMQAALNQAAETSGFPGQILVKADPALPAAAFMLDWGEGKAGYDPNEAAARVDAALHTALAAEGLHAEPLLPPTPATGEF